MFSVVVGWLLFSALVASLGAIAARWLMLPRVGNVDGPSPIWFRNGAARVGLAGATVLPMAMILVLVRQVAEFRDPFAPLADDVRLLLGTLWGTTWLWATFASVGAPAGFLAAVTGRRWGWWLGSAAMLVLATFPGFTGHAGGVEGATRWLTLGADTLHVLAVGAWIGGLAVVLSLELRWRRSRAPDEPESLLPALIPRFSPVAMVSVGTLIVTGMLASWMHVPSIDALWTTGYGRLLVLKVTLVLVVLGIGTLNWRRLTPLLPTSAGQLTMRRAAGLELVLATVVLLITAILVRTSPLGH